MKYLLSILLVISVVGCSKQERVQSQDSLFTKPLNPQPVGVSHPDSTGLIVDSFMVQQQPDIERLKGIDPVRVVALYNAYQPLRNSSTTPAQRESFLKKGKITSVQLQSILAEGDRLGWGKALRRK